ncbi:NAD(P)/FAD-dependent oxidoreductase [Streptomyces sp. H27-D2]|uniref:NAD(P)/FAD-dependent oxidoreductase n=1 Tax=Streptomyces sp. H27-D2 TaxID=3046304 RepID=UPI002DB85014|nr:FAD-dependent oxidoreductase [Streptomyces sp. H27-D2]MEC4017659.1 FAD-dependent oxidoreductase [Streptomyces sp. H27-D2]
MAASGVARTSTAGPGPGVVVVGAGQGGTDTTAALRARGYSGPITLVSDETAMPYQRPPLSKGYLSGAVSGEDIELRSHSYFSALDIDLVRGDRAEKIDRDAQSVLLASGRRLPYEHLVLTTGARPRTLPVPGAELSGVLTLRGLDDAEELRERFARGRSLALVVIGAGFIGLELAATARKLGHEVTVVEALPRAIARAVTPEMSARLTAEHRRQGARILLRREVTALHGDGTGHVRVVELDGGERLPADLVVIGVGVLPNADLAVDAGLLVGDGVIVDQHLRTSDPAIHAIGDCARFPSPRAGRHIRLESVQNASGQARCVAAAVLGEAEPYTDVPWFWSEQYAMKLQIAGLTGDHDETVLTGDPDGGRFSVFCFRAGRLIGVESVNRPADHGIARRLLASGTDLSPHDVARPGFDLKTHPRESAQRTKEPNPV